MDRSRIRDYGFTPGRLPRGERNSITDVPGVKVGHWTRIDEQHQTGVTVILPRKEIYLHKCTAAVHVINGYGKSAGLVQMEELGQLETPIALTNTLNVGLVSDALVQYTIEELAGQGRTLRSLNPVVGECNDSGLNQITERVVAYPQVMEAIRIASDAFEQGSVGAGAGMTCHDLKGGIGSASRILKIGRKTFTIGILALCNHGNLADLMICGRPVGQEILAAGKEKPRQAEGAEGADPEQRDVKPHQAADAEGADPEQGDVKPRQAAGAEGADPEQGDVKPRQAAGAETAYPEQVYSEMDPEGAPGQRRREALVSKSEDVGSCIIVVGTDLPVSDRQLKRIIRRSAAGLARCGSYWGHGSGDIAIGFSTAHDIAEDETRGILEQKILNERMVEQAFLATAEATEESVLNALAAARPVPIPGGGVRHALCEYL